MGSEGGDGDSSNNDGVGGTGVSWGDDEGGVVMKMVMMVVTVGVMVRMG